MIESLSGKKFGLWTVIKRTPPKHTGKRQKQAFYLCICACGIKKPVKAQSLKNGRSTSCGCGPTGHGRKRPFEATYNTLVAKEPHRSRGFYYKDYLSFTSIKICHYCGARVMWLPHRKKEPKSYGHNLDRKDNNKGYSKINCVVCCGSCNRTKGDRFSYEEFMLLAPALRKIQRLRAHENRN